MGLGLLFLLSGSPSAPTDRQPKPPGIDVAAPPPKPGPQAKTILEADRESLPPAVQRYLASTVDPPGTGRLTTAQDDLLHPNRRYEDYRRVLDTYSENPDEVVSILFTTDHFFYTGDETVRLRIRAKRGETPITPLSIDASAVREGRAGPEGDREPLRFHREGDEMVAELDTTVFADHHGPIVVDARIEYARDAFYDETLRFFFTPPGRIPARFTGEIRDRLENGSLRVDIGIDVEQAGFYRFDANLHDRFGNPIAFSTFKGELDRGRQFVPIRFFGRILVEVGSSGPFTVGEIRGYRFLDGQYPDRERIPDLARSHTTAAYDVGTFSSAEYTSEHKERMVRLLMEDVANGISIEPPPAAAVSTPPSP